MEEKAKLSKQIEIAKNMLEDNEPNEKIAKYTGLTLEQIETLLGTKKHNFTFYISTHV